MPARWADIAPLPASVRWDELPALVDASVSYAPQAVIDADLWLERLRSEIAWEQHRVRLFGREMDAPRLSCWVGDPGAAYTYSKMRFEPRPWTPALDALRRWLQALLQSPFNSVLCNLYRNGQDSMGWHSDDEPELGAAPTIASLSFGAPRRFRLRHKNDPALRREWELASGSLLLMAGTTQRFYRHDLPKSARSMGSRINLTFRQILLAAN